tara:strand:+ start:237 stop:770 length:534 start_codon:yes stop_codon:yes gene_type:complete
MALSLNAADGCKYLSVIINYTATSTTVLGLNILDADGSSVAGTVAPTFTITPGSGPISYPIPVSDLTISNGIVTVVLTSQTGNAIPGGQESALLHCDIDCCLTKLTNELIDCACDCAKCASSLAKAQKVYLLITSADYAIIQANEGSDSARPGFIKDAKTKYLKAKEICDESCGCNC